MAEIVEWIREIPPITRTYAVGAVLTTACCSLELLSPYSLYFSATMVFEKMQFWRLLTNFLYFGDKFNIDFLFHMFFLVGYSKALEERSFRNKTADYFYMVLFGVTCFMSVAPFTNLHFFGSSLTFMMVYLWSRRTPGGRMNFIFLFDFTAPYLPWVMLSFSLFLQKDLLPDILGILVGHLYYFLEDVYPRMTRPPIRLLRTPRLIQLLFAPDIAVPVAQAAPAGDINAAANIINADAAELNAEDDDDDDD